MMIYFNDKKKKKKNKKKKNIPILFIYIVGICSQ